jgi:Zn-dependent alcohol dehydrogenase
VAVGDHVIQTFIGPCGRCPACRRGQRTFCHEALPADGTLLDGTFRMHARDGSDIATTLRLGTFSAHTVTPEINCVAVPKDIELTCAALVSCGVSTGMGAALNVAGVGPGDDVAVVGIGGVGVAALVGSVLAGAARVIAVDLQESKRPVALAFGASQFVNGGTDDVAAVLRDATAGRGVDKVLLTADRIVAALYPLAVECLAPGGVVVQVGTPDVTLDHIPVPPYALLRKQLAITGTVYGGMDTATDALRWLDLFRSGRLPLDRFVTRTYPLEDINRAFADMAEGRNIRGVVLFD